MIIKDFADLSGAELKASAHPPAKNPLLDGPYFRPASQRRARVEPLQVMVEHEARKVAAR